MNNFILNLPKGFIIDLEIKDIKMSTETPKSDLKIIKISDNLEIAIKVAKTDERHIITKKESGRTLFYKMYCRACKGYLSGGTHFENYAAAKNHFDSYIKTNWKHTKAFKIEPISNYFISNWVLDMDETTNYWASYDLSLKNRVYLKNKPLSIDDFKRGTKVTTVEQLIKTFKEKTEGYSVSTKTDIERMKKEIDAYKQRQLDYENQLFIREKRFNELQNSKELLESIIKENTTSSEETVFLFYGKE